jgi:EmrB/QacA subfamily drug resistance transporter
VTASSDVKTNRARRSAHPTLVLLLIAGAQLMVVLDATIVNIALPTMGEYFDKNQTSMTWALNAYTLTFGGLLLLGGRSGDILGRRRMFIIGLGLFTLGSLLGGIATTYAFLLFGRVIQGAGGAIASPTALSLITNAFAAGRERTRAFAVYAAVSGAGAALGLMLGGILTEYLTWRWVLFVNVPIGIVLMVGAFLYLHETERHEGRFDYLGGVLSIFALVGIVYGFIHAASDGWSNPITIVTLGGGALLLAVFFFVETKVEDPMVPMRVILDRNRGGSYLIMLIVGAGLFGMFYFVTFFVQQVMGFSALKAGFSFLPVTVVIAITSGVMTKLMPKFGPKPMILAGTILLTSAMLWYSTVDASASYWTLFFPGMIVMATGMGCIFVPLTTVAVAGVRPTDAGVASAMLNVGQQVGGSVGLSVLATVAATAGRNYAKAHASAFPNALGALPQDLQRSVGGFVQSKGATGPQPGDVKNYIGTLPPSQRGTVSAWFNGPFHEAAANIQAHASAMGFLAAACFGFASIIVTIVLINVKKDDLPAEPVALAEATAAV